MAVGLLAALAAVLLARWRPSLRTSALGLAAGGAVALSPLVDAFTPLRQPVGPWAPLLVLGGGFAAGWSARATDGRTSAALLAVAAGAVFVTVPDTEMATGVVAAVGAVATVTLVGWVQPPNEVAAALAGAAVALGGLQGSAAWPSVLVAVAAIVVVLAAPALAPTLWPRLGLGRTQPPRLLPTAAIVAPAMLVAGRVGGVRSTTAAALVVGALAAASAVALLGLLGRRR